MGKWIYITCVSGSGYHLYNWCVRFWWRCYLICWAFSSTCIMCELGRYVCYSITWNFNCGHLHVAWIICNCVSYRLPLCTPTYYMSVMNFLSMSTLYPETLYLLLSLLSLHMFLCYLEMLVEWKLLTAFVRVWSSSVCTCPLYYAIYKAYHCIYRVHMKCIPTLCTYMYAVHVQYVHI